MIDYDDVRQKLKDGEYDCKVKYPSREDFPKYPENHVFDENLSVKANREMIATENAKYDNAFRGYRVSQAAAEKRFNDDLNAAIMNDGVSLKTAEMIFGRAYEDGHSGGMDEVINGAECLTNFALDIIEAEQNKGKVN